jgi:hypothetical protein
MTTELSPDFYHFGDLDVTVLRDLEAKGVELDQRMRTAFEKAGSDPSDDALLIRLCQENCSLLRLLSLTPTEWSGALSLSRGLEYLHHSRLRGWTTLDSILRHAIRKDGNSKVLRTSDFLRAVFDAAEEDVDHWGLPGAAKMLARALTGDPRRPLSEIPRLQRARAQLRQRTERAEDYQYIVTLEDNTLRFRIVSTLDDYVQENDSGRWTPQRALLSHLDGLGLFTADCIHELEDLLNSGRAKEGDFQAFFERHPNFLRRWDFREVYPHVFLTRRNEGPLIPDFLLTNVEAQDAAILDIKQSGMKIIRHQKNRLRFTDAILEARAQLLTYRSWFDDADHRAKIKSKVGMEIYRPRMMVVIGRSSEFRDEIDRQTLRADNPDIEVVTYDDILRFARGRRMILEDRRIWDEVGGPH